MPDWKKIKAEYIRDGTSYRKLAQQYGVSFSSLSKIATREKWTDLRKQAGIRQDTKIVESVASQEAKRVNKVDQATDMLLDRVIEGIADGSFTTNPSDIRQLMLAMKDIREIKGMKSELDMQEQMARIEKLRKEAQSEEESKDIKVVISSDLDDYSG